jgi:hypothetical protein
MMIMKRELTRLSRRYTVALRKYLKRRPRASLQPARGLGRRAISLGLETLDVARIHEAAVASLEASSSRDGIIKRAGVFFAEAITPIEKTHRAALKANVHLHQLARTLGRRAVELAASGRHLKRGIIRRKAAEEALKKSGKHRTNLLKQSRLVQEHLRYLTHQILLAPEDKRTKMSHKLHDEIAQTLLGINVRLVTLKQEATVNAKGLKKGIAGTQRLVEKSKKTPSRFADELGKHNGTQAHRIIATLSGGVAKTPKPRLTSKLQAGPEIGPAGHGPRAGDVGPGQDSRTSVDCPRVAGLLRQHPGRDGP